MYQSSCCSTSLLTIGITELLDFNHPDKYEMASISFMLKIGIFLTAGEGGDFFSCISWSLEASLSLTVYILFSFFPLGCCLFLIDLSEFFTYFRSESIGGICIVNIFSHIGACLFIFLVTSLHQQKFLILM